MNQTPWDKHYTRERSVLMYPDENLVRMIKKHVAVKEAGSLSAVDLGCGTGRHLKMLSEAGIRNITGLDNSFNAVKICKESFSSFMVQGDNRHLPFKDLSFDIAVSWGSLHYCAKDFLPVQMDEIYRVIAGEGCFFGTLRSERDTYLKKGRDLGNGTWITDLSDIENSIVSFYSEDELNLYFKAFSKFEYGLIERTILGDMTKVISHWIFRAVK